MDKEDLLYRYFSNALTPEQDKLFNELLSTDQQFREQFNFEKDLQRVIQDKQGTQLKSKLAGFEKDILVRSIKESDVSQQKADTATRKQTNSDSTPVHTLPKTNYRKWAFAASFALLVGLGWLGFNNLAGPDLGELYQNNYREYPNTVYTITRSDQVESIEREAFAAYESGNYQTALENFDRIPTENQKSYLDFYRAQSYLQLDDLENAQGLFESNIQSNTDFVPESYWYLALTYLGQEEKAKAISTLEKLSSNYEYNRETALVLLNELR